MKLADSLTGVSAPLSLHDVHGVAGEEARDGRLADRIARRRQPSIQNLEYEQIHQLVHVLLVAVRKTKRVHHVRRIVGRRARVLEVREQILKMLQKLRLRSQKGGQTVVVATAAAATCSSRCVGAVSSGIGSAGRQGGCHLRVLRTGAGLDLHVRHGRRGRFEQIDCSSKRGSHVQTLQQRVEITGAEQGDKGGAKQSRADRQEARKVHSGLSDRRARSRRLHRPSH